MINNELDALNWDELFTNQNLDEMVNTFYEVINSIIERYTPVLRPKNDSYPKWFTQKIIQLISDKNYYRDLFKKTNLETFNIFFKMKRRELKYELRVNENKYTKCIENTVKTNTKAFFAYTKSLNKSNKLPCTMNFDNDSPEDPEEIANYLFRHKF